MTRIAETIKCPICSIEQTAFRGAGKMSVGVLNVTCRNGHVYSVPPGAYANSERGAIFVTGQREAAR